METRRFNVDQLIDIPLAAVAVKEIMAGTYKDEIDRITAARKDLESLRAKATAEAEKILNDAQHQAGVLREEAQTTLDAAIAKGARVTQAQNELTTAQRQLANDVAALKAATSSAESTSKALRDALDAREAVIAGREAKLIAAESKLSADRAEFNKRLESLKA